MSENELTVLVVEDEESFVDALTVGLRREGFLVVVARDGVEAMTQFDKYKPDVVLLDVMLPKVSGIDVCRQIRAKSRTPVIMVTAKTSEIDTVVALDEVTGELRWTQHRAPAYGMEIAGYGGPLVVRGRVIVHLEHRSRTGDDRRDRTRPVPAMPFEHRERDRAAGIERSRALPLR